MQQIPPHHDLQLVVKHHDPHRVPKQHEHLVVHVHVLLDVPTHRLCRVVVCLTTHLVRVLAQLILDFVQFSQVYLVQQVGANQLSVVLNQVEHFLPVLPSGKVEVTLWNDSHAGHPHQVVKEVVKE